MPNKLETTIEERAIYIGERLFGLIDVSRVDIPSNYGFSSYGDLCKYTHQEVDNYTFKYAFGDWLSSLLGLNAVERAMINLGWQYTIRCYINEPACNSYCYTCIFQKEFNRYRGEGKTSSEAILTGAYNALKGEEKL